MHLSVDVIEVRSPYPTVVTVVTVKYIEISHKSKSVSSLKLCISIQVLSDSSLVRAASIHMQAPKWEESSITHRNINTPSSPSYFFISFAIELILVLIYLTILSKRPSLSSFKSLYNLETLVIRKAWLNYLISSISTGNTDNTSIKNQL